MPSRSRAGLAWLLFLVTFACLLGGLVVTLFVTRPLTVDVLVNGAFEGAEWLLFATIGLVLTLRRPANPIGWLYAAAGVVWSAYIPADPWVDQLQRTGRPVPLVARYLALIGENFWAIGIVLAIILPLLLLPDGRLRSPPRPCRSSPRAWTRRRRPRPWSPWPSRSPSTAGRARSPR